MMDTFIMSFSNLSTSAFVSNSSSLSRQCSENGFGPAACQGDFDFTLLFEQSILSILPSTILLSLVPFRLFRLYRASTKTLPDLLLPLKLATTLCYSVVQIVLLVLWSLNSMRATVASIPSTALSFVDSVAICLLSFFEHKRSVRPSVALNVYLLVSVIFDAAQVRTLYLTHKPTAISAVMTISLATKVLLLFLEAQEKSSSLKSPFRLYSPEAKSGIWSMSFFWWLNSLFRQGFNKLLTANDLFETDTSMSSEALSLRIHKVWDALEPKGKHALPHAAASCFGWDLLFVAFPRLCLVGFNFSQPFLITRAITFLSEPQTSNSNNIGYGLIAATGLIYLGIALSTVHYNYQFYRVLTKFRGAMVALIYDKTLHVKDGAYNESTALTLMSTDVDTIIGQIENLNEIWARTLEIAIGIWLLARQLGAPCVVPMLVVIACTFGQGWVAKHIGASVSKWNEAVQRRVAATSSMLGSMKAVKTMGLQGTLTTFLQGERLRELSHLNGFLNHILLLNMMSNAPEIWSTLLTFVAYIIQANVQHAAPLNTAQAFTSLAIIALITNPAANLLSSIPQSAAALGPFARIQAFLLSGEAEDKRLRYGLTSSSMPTSERLDDVELVAVQPKSQTADGERAFIVSNVTISPAEGARPAISEASFAVRKGDIVLIIGPVGSGKTTLMKAMLGELPCTLGSIAVASARIAYCSQTAWLLNVSIQQSVCGCFPGSPIDEQWYDKVMHACALDQDMLQLPDGERSVLGSKGLTLSGGQKQRLALARAIYARQDVVMLDDVLSALDAKTEKTIMQRLMGREGLLRRSGTTVVLITHAIRLLPLADNILVLDATGHLTQQGTYESLASRNDLFAFVTSNDPSTTENTEERTPAVKGSSKAVDKPDDEEREDLSRRTGDFSVYKYYVKSFGIRNLYFFLGVMLVDAVVLYFPQVWIQMYTSGGFSTGVFLGVYAMLAFFAFVFVGLQIWIVFKVILPKSAANLHQIVLDTVMNAPIMFFAKTDTGVTLNRFSQDMTLVDTMLPRGIVGVGAAGFACIAQLALVSLGSAWLAIAIPFMLIAIYVIQNVYLRTSRQLRLMDLESRSPLYSHFLETLDGLATIRVFGSQFQARDINIKRLDESQKPYYLLQCVQRWLNLVLDLMTGAMAIVVMALAVQLRHSIDPGLLGVSLNVVLSFGLTLSNLVNSWTLLETSLGAISRVKSFTESILPEPQSQTSVVPPPNWPSEGEITFQAVTASYASTYAIPTLDNITLKLHAGHKIGIIGRTGSGKSSLLLSLLRLLPLTSGTIAIDNIDIATIAHEELRSRITCIPQDPFFLSGSVRLNADPSATVTDSAIIAALERVHLWNIIQERGGLDAHMLADVSLSQGQAQLFCLVRAMLRAASKVVLMDEATSHVDSETDLVMQRVMREEFGGRTLVVVAHRLETVMDADTVVVMEGGKVVEVGSPAFLIVKEGGILRGMWERDGVE